MELNHLVQSSIADTLASLWPAFGPELILCATILLMLILRLFRWTSRWNAAWIALAGSLCALYYAYPWQHLGGEVPLPRYELFTGMLVYDSFSVFVRGLLLLFAVLFALFTQLSGIPDRQDSADFYCLVLGATLGMCLMASANHLFIVFLAVEMASVPSYALAAMLKGRRQASEAALKYAIYGAGAAGVMLYGISLLAGITNSAHLPTVAAQLAADLPQMVASQKIVLALAGVMIAVGLAFKLSAVPFHFWCPDVFEGASAEVNAFLSVASKAGALALLVRVCIGVGVIPTEILGPPGVELRVAEDGSGQDFFARPRPAAQLVSTQATTLVAETPPADSLAPVRTFIAWLVAFISVLSSTFGNLAAYGQTNIKRLLAYSTIAHAGYMMLPIPVMMELATTHPDVAAQAVASLSLYLAFYLFMNLGAFAIVAFLRNALRSEQIADYAGLIHRSPGMAICFAVILFSLVGIPPLAGFVGKFAVFASLADGYRLTGQAYLLILFILGGLNTVLSLFYYLRVVKVMVIDSEPERPSPQAWSMISLSGVFTVLISLPLLLFFLNWDVLNRWTETAAANLF